MRRISADGGKVKRGRLSRLQNYILTEAQKNDGVIYRRNIYLFWPKEKLFARCVAFHRYHGGTYRCIGSQYRVSACRAVKRLEERGLIFTTRAAIIIRAVAINNKRGARP